MSLESGLWIKGTKIKIKLHISSVLHKCKNEDYIKCKTYLLWYKSYFKRKVNLSSLVLNMSGVYSYCNKLLVTRLPSQRVPFQLSIQPVEQFPVFGSHKLPRHLLLHVLLHVRPCLPLMQPSMQWPFIWSHLFPKQCLGQISLHNPPQYPDIHLLQIPISPVQFVMSQFSGHLFLQESPQYPALQPCKHFPVVLRQTLSLQLALQSEYQFLP